MADTTPVFRYVEGVFDAEDLILLPWTKWVIGSGVSSVLRPAGRIHAIDSNSEEVFEIFPEDAKTAPSGEFDVAEPPDTASLFAHGIALSTAPHPSTGQPRLFVVNHGGRETIEVLDITLDDPESKPHLTWVGAISQPADLWANACAALPDGGLVVSKTKTPEEHYDNAGPGDIRRWDPSSGWSTVPGTTCEGANGVVVSADGRTLFLNAWTGRQLIRVGLDGDGSDRAELDLPFMPDNVRWSPDGKLLVAGQATTVEDLVPQAMTGTAAVPATVWKVDPATLDGEEVIGPDAAAFGLVATAIDVNGEYWLSNACGERIAIVSVA